MRPASTMHGRGVRRLNVMYWLRHVNPADTDAQDRIRRYVEAAGHYRTARAPPERHHVIDEGGGGLDVYKAVWWQNRVAATLDEVRSMGYDGSIRLLKDLYDASYDVGRIIHGHAPTLGVGSGVDYNVRTNVREKRSWP